MWSDKNNNSPCTTFRLPAFIPFQTSFTHQVTTTILTVITALTSLVSIALCPHQGESHVQVGLSLVCRPDLRQLQAAGVVVRGRPQQVGAHLRAVQTGRDDNNETTAMSVHDENRWTALARATTRKDFVRVNLTISRAFVN